MTMVGTPGILQVDASKAYVEVLVKMLGDLADAEMLRRVAQQHDDNAVWLDANGREGRGKIYRQAARALRARAAKLA
jgi:hypothetical protein